MVDAPRVACIAGPGSGKTRTLVAAAIHWQETHPTKTAAVVTFTRQAAAEITERFKGYGRFKGAIHAGTLHGLAREIVKANYQKLGYPAPEIEIYDEEDALSVMKEVQRYSRRKLSLKKLRNAVNDEYDETGDAKHYRMLLRERCAIDYDLLITQAKKVLLHGGWSPFDALFVDEGQDLSADQWGLLYAIAPERLFVVGDPDQAIYGWRGASVEHYDAFMDSAEVVRLPDSYRCPPEILHWAQRFILSESSVDVAQPSNVFVSGVFPESFGNSGTVGVLCRTRATAGAAYERFSHLGSSIELVGIEKPQLQAGVVKVVVAMACWPGYPNSIAMGRKVIRGLCSVPETGLLEIERDAARSGRPLLDVATEALSPLRDLYARYLGIYQDAPPDGMGLSAWVSACASHIMRSYGSSHMKAISKLLAQFIAGTRWSDRTLRNFHGWYVGNDDLDMSVEDAPVKVMTMHAAKGREFDDVVICADYYNTDPSKLDDEERRVLYVAVTRSRRAVAFVQASGGVGWTGGRWG